MPLLARLTELFAERRGRVLAFCWLGWVFDFYDLILFAFVKRGVAAELGLELTTDIAWIDGLSLGATALGGVLFGRLADRCGRRRALSSSILVFSAGTFATAFADSFETLCAARLVTGVGVGGEWGVGHAVVAETYPERLRNRAAAVLQAGSPVAMALAAAIGCFVAPHVGWRSVFLWSALPALLVVFARVLMPGPDTAPGRGQPARLLDVFRGGRLRPSLALLGVLALHMTGFWCTYAWLPAILLREHPAWFVGVFQISINAVHVVADVAFGLLADRFGRRRTFVAFCLLFAVGLAAIALGFRSLRSDVVLFGVVLGAVGLGAGTWSCFGVLFAENYPAAIRATAASGFYNVSRGVQLVTQPLMGQLMAWTGSYASALWVGAAASIGSTLLIGAVRTEPTRAAA
ncbi:MAG: MFS transporter [Planctomycetes bacterium]|nr:MFS transporter [Planctomycetota bacterium]